MNSSYFPKALIVEHPEILSPSKLSKGDFDIDSILVHCLYAGIVDAKRQNIIIIINGMKHAMYQFVREITMSTERLWNIITQIPPNVRATFPSNIYKSLENLFIIVPVGVTS